MQKKKNSYMQRRTKDVPNKKLIVWVSSIFGAVIILMAVLLVVNQS